MIYKDMPAIDSNGVRYVCTGRLGWLDTVDETLVRRVVE